MHTLLGYSPVGGSSSSGLFKVHKEWELEQRKEINSARGCSLENSWSCSKISRFNVIAFIAR